VFLCIDAGDAKKVIVENLETFGRLSEAKRADIRLRTAPIVAGDSVEKIL